MYLDTHRQATFDGTLFCMDLYALELPNNMEMLQQSVKSIKNQRHQRAIYVLLRRQVFNFF